jgi:NAD(P)-dependent dehydrogenase (short-subunit alcohol dehydrogenase family)
MAERTKTQVQETSQPPARADLSESGRARRRFLERTALAAAGTATLVPIAAGAADDGAASGGAAPSDCPDVRTPMQDVEGKVAFITGGDSGIGLGMARAFAEAGMKIVITYRTKRHLDQALEALKSAGSGVHAINVDVTDRPGMEKAADEAASVFGKIHVLVNNAGVAVFAPLTTATYNDWDWGMGVNVNGVFNGVHTFLPRIRAHGEGGQIVATSSIAGLIVDDGPGIYSTSKFAVVGMMEALRAELADTNIGVSVFCPGIVNTDIGESNRNRPASLSDPAGNQPPPDPKMMARMRAAMRRMGPPPGMDPLEAGRLVLRGIRNNDLYILNTPEFETDLRARSEAILASMPVGLKVPQARVIMERMIMGKSVYIAERDRKRCERARTRKT